MAISKTSTVFTWASGSATASGTTSPIGTLGDYAQQVYVDLVQTGTATTPASFIVQVTPDGVTWFSLLAITAQTAAGTYDWVIDLPITAEAVRLQYSAQSGGTSSSLTAQLGQITAV